VVAACGRRRAHDFHARNTNRASASQRFGGQRRSYEAGYDRGLSKDLGHAKTNRGTTFVVRAKIASISLAIQFERAKQFLLEGKFGDALDCIEHAKAITPLWKLRLAELGLRLFPHLLQSLYRAHLRRVENRKRAQREESLKLAGFANRTIDGVTRTSSAAVSAAVRRASRSPGERAAPSG
jgi:hypothetical protein